MIPSSGKNVSIDIYSSQDHSASPQFNSIVETSPPTVQSSTRDQKIYSFAMIMNVEEVKEDELLVDSGAALHVIPQN